MDTVNVKQQDPGNPIFSIATALVQYSSRNLFLTGKAGTGKTTFLKFIRDNCPKQLAILAPTGVAAINAGGVTIHSFFQLPLSPFIPENQGLGNNDAVADKHSLLSRLRLTSEKLKVIRELELLVIDEISMVRCDTIDAIDTVLRYVRHRPSDPFGGVQLLCIGDLFQLPPVMPDQDWRILSEYYASPYFFDSRIIRTEPLLCVEFEKIYRQSEQDFIELLNRVRNNDMNPAALALLEARLDPTFRRTPDDGFIVLTTHNAKADQINADELRRIGSPPSTYTAEIKGEFLEKAYPADEHLLLKPGAQVMFIKNDSADRGRRYFNGRIGTISHMEPTRIFVQCGDDPEAIEVIRETWDNVRYSVNKDSRVLESEQLGSFVQFPLRLAWAITIHKSQGLTFEKVIIDAEAAFAPGQVYVALSRCISLSGVVLLSSIRTSSLRSDPRIVHFSKQMQSPAMLQAELVTARNEHKMQLLSSVFDLVSVVAGITELTALITEHKKTFNDKALPWASLFASQATALQQIAAKFQVQLRQLFQSGQGETALWLQRIRAATAYFLPKLDELIRLLHSPPAITDSRLQAKEFNDGARDLFSTLSLKRWLIADCDTGFDPEKYYARRTSFRQPSFTINAYAGSNTDQQASPHPELYRKLRQLRDAICQKTELPVYMVAGSDTLFEMSRYLPQSLTELKQIAGFGEARVKKYGADFIEIIAAYCQQNNLESLMVEKQAVSPKKKATTKKKPADTKLETVTLFRTGHTIRQIALDRRLTEETIERHLLHYLELGEIGIDRLVSPETRKKIEPFLSEFDRGSIETLKEQLGHEVTFTDLRFMLAWHRFNHAPGTFS